MGIDLLKDDKRKALLAITTVQVEKLYIQLLENPESRAIMHSRGQTLLLYSIIRSCDEFLAKEYGYKVKVNRRQVKLSLYTKFLLKNAEILFRVPYYSILDPSNPNFNSIYAPVYKTPSPTLLEAFLDNLVIEIGITTPMYLNIFQLLPYRDPSKYQALKLFPNPKETNSYLKSNKTTLPSNGEYRVRFPFFCT